MDESTAQARLKGFKPVRGTSLNQEQAERYGRRILELAAGNNETVSREMVLDDARAPESPLHDYFEWDDSVAAEQWRLTQANQLCRSIHVVYENSDGEEDTLPILVNVRLSYGDEGQDPWPEAPERRGARQAYSTISAAVSDEAKHAFLLWRLLSDLRSLQRKYAMLQDEEVLELFQAIDRTREKLLAALRE